MVTCACVPVAEDAAVQLRKSGLLPDLVTAFQACTLPVFPESYQPPLARPVRLLVATADGLVAGVVAVARVSWRSEERRVGNEWAERMVTCACEPKNEDAADQLRKS